MRARFSNWFRNSLLLIFGITLAACTGYKSGLPPDYNVLLDSANGVVVGSVGTNPLGKQWREWSQYLYLSSIDQKKRGSVASAVNWSNPFFPQPECPDDGLEAECGNLFAIILPAGEYEFWAVIPAMDSNAADNSTRYAVGLEGYKFEVQPGEATYIGNMLSRLCGGSSYSYYGTAAIGRARVAQGDVADRYARDLPLLVAKFPQLKNAVVKNETMPGVPWRWEWEQRDGTSVAANWQSDCAPVREVLAEPSLQSLPEGQQ